MSVDTNQALPENLAGGPLRTTAAMAQLYAALTADFNPIHLDPGFAAKTSFGTPIIHGTMGLNLLVQAIQATFGDDCPELEIDVRFVRPVHVGATIRAGGKLKDAALRSYEIFVETEAGERAVEGTCTLGPRPHLPRPTNPEDPT
jgi:3-hydroxybutyryl-CoA dehydratase